MDKKKIKERILLGTLALLALIMPFFVFVFLPPLMLSLWATGICALFMAKRKNAKVSDTKRYQMLEKLLYFQIINWAFGYFIFIQVLHLIVWVIVIVLIVLSLNKNRRTNNKFIKWAKYVGFHLFNLALILVLFNNFPYIGEGGFAVIPLITFLNGITAAIYLTALKGLPSGGKRIFALIIILLMMAGTVVSAFPQASGIPVIELILGGS
jgi:hypothetical protein